MLKSLSVLQKIALVLFLTTVIGGIYGAIEMAIISNNTSEYVPYGQYLILGIALTLLFIALPNVCFLLLLYYSNLLKLPLENMKYLIIEICLVFLTIRTAEYLVRLLPIDVLYETTPTYTVLRPIFQTHFIYIYSFCFLFLIAVTIKMLMKKKIENRQ